jgi:biopolymer transport protein ExbD
MGYPEPKRTTNSGNVGVAIALLAGAALVFLGVVFALRLVFFRSQPPMVATPAVMGYTTVTEVATPQAWSTNDLVVEIDQQGQTYYNGQPMPLEQIRPQIQEAMTHVGVGSETIIRVEENCPFEYVEPVVAMYQELGVSDPRMATIPPRRTVAVKLDEQGKATIDGAPADNPQQELQRIASRHGSRAKVTIEAHPQCPSQFVVQLAQHSREVGFGDVKVQSLKEHMAERTD